MNNFKQTNYNQISDHIHEWRHHLRMVKTFFPDQFLVEWFVKSMLPYIIKDVARGGIAIEEKVISHAQYLDVIYTQSGMLYEKILNVPRSNFIVPPQLKDSHVRDSIIGTTSTHHTTTYDPTPSSEINVMSFNKGKSDKQPRSKEKGNSKKKRTSNMQERSSDQSFGTRKPHYPCIIYNGNTFFGIFLTKLKFKKWLKLHMHQLC